MAKLLFQNPVFDNGENVSCRKGIKWDLADKKNVEVSKTGDPDILKIVDIQTKVMRFCDIRDSDIKKEHDPACRTIGGLTRVMKDVYPGFDERELITLVTFNW